MNNRDKVYEIFQDYFGEDNVDLQDNMILIHFPKVTVTNEFDNKIDITHLFVSSYVRSNGTLERVFTVNRSEYTEDQFLAGYLHSHARSINYTNLSAFMPVCLGTGPLNSTIRNLMNGFDEDLWKLYCCELDLYVRTESISGVPYIRLESVGAKSTYTFKLEEDHVFLFFDIDPKVEYVSDIICKKAVEKKILRFAFNKDAYILGMPLIEAAVLLSNLYIEWYNSLPNEKKPEVLYPESNIAILNKMKLKDGHLWTINNYGGDSVEVLRHIGTHITTFKGRDYTLQISDFGKKPTGDISVLNILSLRVIGRIITKLLIKINYEYNRPRVYRTGFREQNKDISNADIKVF